MRIKIFFLIICMFAVTSISTSSHASRGAGSIDLSANPDVIAADGQSMTTVSAQVRDRDGHAVPDGTEIRFSASQGSIDAVGTTSSGVARVNLTSSSIPGTSTVTATWVEGPAVAQASVVFGTGSSANLGPKYISIEAGDYLAYSADSKIIDAVGNVKIKYRSLELEAHDVQIDISKNHLVAKAVDRTHPLKISTSTGIAQGNMFSCDLMNSKGLFFSVDNGKVLRIDLSKPVPEVGSGETDYSATDFEFADLSESAMVIKAQSATVFLNQKINFTHASLYIGGKLMFSLPYYLFPLTDSGPDAEQYVGIGNGGATLSLPMYYALTPSSSGALLLRHGQSSGWGWYGQDPGWYLSARQKYSTDSAQGQFDLNQITSGNWGATFSHTQNLGNATKAYVYLDYPEHSDLYGNINLSKSFNAFNMGLNLSGNKMQSGSDSLNSTLFLQSRPKPMLNLPLQYTLSTRSVYSAGSAQTGKLAQFVEGDISSKPLPISKNMSLMYTAGLGYAWSDVIGNGITGHANAIVNWKLSGVSSFQLSYRYADRTDLLYSTVGRQSLSGNLFLLDPNNRWRASLYAIYGLDYPSTSIFGDASYMVAPGWRLGVRSTYNSFGSYDPYNDLELAVGKSVGSRELIIAWSRSQGKLMFELGSTQF